MKTPLSSAGKMLLVSVSFCLLLTVVRMCYTGSIMYGFYIWNMVLALVPLAFSRKLAVAGRLRWHTLLLFAGWLVFFPNAPYLVTDVFHFAKASAMPKWFDLILVISAAWNGLLLGILSLMHVERFLVFHFSQRAVHVLLAALILLCGYGVYIGRFLRFNSWDVVTDPLGLLAVLGGHWLQPAMHVTVWGFTFLFAALFSIAYFTLRQWKE
ncbi:DUF1361 domain-containing protein [Chitinophaga lutea]|uniref:DUF1361 domain-containing protein n=1 Tax=Chitinophaga lutea TaxID=2488634 RepID=A0A3N4PY93_9BACT|nr:DUF1361 domain-containing protein [Chitinophaga lutea]RPE08640.1 DUF1361 domain-containing protein [Chitinophaga lutea]